MGGRTYRHEWKHYINMADHLELRSRLRHIARHDANAGPDGSYLVRSLYFDDYADKAVTDKLSGQSRREKFRIRYYNGDPSFIRLEKKSKINRGCRKESAAIDIELCRRILDGDYSGLLSDKTPLTSELYAKIRFQNLRPRSVVDYTREAYIFPAGNVRITIDFNMRSGDNTAGFLNPALPTIPSANATILEVKFDGFLPDVIRDALQLHSRHRTEFSKYVTARLI